MEICNLCGKPLMECDGMNGSPLIIDPIGYGSIYDGEILVFRACNSCLDRIINDCRESPVYHRELEIVDSTPPKLKLIK